MASIDQIKTVLELVNKSTEDGSTFDEFKKHIADEGIQLSDHHLANIYRTNMQMAYAHGRWTQQQANKESRPYLMYVAINDSRVRPTHLKLNNIIRHIDDPFWTLYYLLASDLNLEVIDITDSEVILKKTEERANRMFIANSTLYVI